MTTNRENKVSINKNTTKEKQFSPKASIHKNTVYNVIKTVSQIIFPLITFPYISRVLHAENVGKINFSSSIISYISLIASLGISTYAIRECSRVRDNHEELNEIASQLLSINIISTAVAYIVLILLLVFWKSLYGYQVLIMIQSINIMFITLGADWLNSSLEDFKYITYRTFFFQLIAIILMFIFVRRPEDYIIYAVITVISSSGANILNMFYRRKYCTVKLTFHIDWKKHLPPIILLFAMILSQTIYVSVDTTMLGIMRTDTEVGWYSTSTKIYSMVNQVIASICWVVMPQLSYQFRNHNYAEIKKLLKYAMNFIVVLGIPCTIGLFIMAPEVIRIIGGTEYLPATTSLRILCFALAFSLAGGFIGNIILLPSNQERLMLQISIVGATINFIANLFLIPLWGLNAAAFTTALSQAVTFLIAYYHIDKKLKLEHKIQIFKAPIIGTIAVAIICFSAKLLIANLWICTFSAVLLSIIVYIAILLVMRNEFVLNIKSVIIRKVNHSQQNLQ